MRLINKKILLTLLIISVSLSCKTISRVFNNGGTEMIVQVETDQQDKDKIIREAVNMIELKINAAGLNGEVSRIADKPDQVSVKLYGANDLEKVKKYLFTTYKLELKKLVSPPSPSPMQTFPTQEAAAIAMNQPDQEVLPYKDRDDLDNVVSAKKFVIVEKNSIVTGTDIRYASAVNIARAYSISFSLKPEGAAKLGDWTGKNINNYIAVVLNKEVVSAAFIKSQIFDQGQIDGRFTKESAEDIAMNLNSGHFPGTLKIIEEKPFGNAAK